MLTHGHFGTAQEYIAGFSSILDVFLLGFLLLYMITNRESIFRSHYCIAVGLCFLLTGHMIRNAYLWFILISDPSITSTTIKTAFPFVGSDVWIVGLFITAIGLVKLIHEFGKAYVGRWAWILGILTATLLPLASLLV